MQTQMTISHRYTPSSPSLMMEKGAYRIHKDIGSPSKLRYGHLQGKQGGLFTHDRRMAGIVVLLVLAISFCFGSAFYLFTTGWVSHSLRRQTPPPDNFTPPYQVVEFDRGLGNAPIHKSAKYLSYLPHSGFHNQRIAFENALIMARILNRTLLVPPVRLGKGSLTYYPFHHLHELVVLSGKDGLGHCADAGSWKTLPVECTDYYDYTMVPWNWLANISTIASAQPIYQRWNLSDAWLSEYLDIQPNETFAIKDTHPYQYRFVDADPLDMPSARFDEVVSMSLLAKLPHQLIQVGSLFGSSRLRLRRRKNIEYRTVVRQSMTFTNEILLELADSIKAELGGVYLAIHVRVGDGTFERKAAKNVRVIWWKLLHEVLKLENDMVLDLEKRFVNTSFSSPPIITPDKFTLRTTRPPLPVPSIVPPQKSCRKPRHVDPRLASLNAPLFISTDVLDPTSHPLLQRFFDMFPCTFFLSDFANEVAALTRLKSGYDGLMLKDFIYPFLDAVIAGKAHEVVGTDGSTFSQFVQDVLWRRYKGWDIVERG